MAEKKPNILFLLIDSFNSRNCFENHFMIYEIDYKLFDNNDK